MRPDVPALLAAPLLLALLPCLPAAPAMAQGATVELPEAEVVGVSPLVGGGIDRDKIPSNVQTLGGTAFDHRNTPDLLSAFERGIAGASLSDQTGNAFQRDLDFRGFTASPVIGTAQGIAVYQNGVRVNEVFGDIVNWDFIPENAIGQMTLLPSSPIFGLNALGGAMSIEMENGFTHHGAEAEARAGSYGRQGMSAEIGGQQDRLAGYAAIDLTHDHGWRNDSSSELHRGYADLGFKDGGAEYHLSLTAAANSFGATAATPVELLASDWASIYTIPQTTKEDLIFLTGTANWTLGDMLSVQGNTYYRGFWQSHVDGNGTDAQNDGCPDPTQICFPDINGNLSNLITTAGQTVPATGVLADGSLLGEIDRTWTTTTSIGGALQVTGTQPLLGLGNHWVAGASVDRGRSHFTSTSELATVNQDQFPFVTGVGLFIDMPGGDVAPVGVLAKTLYLGAYATDTWDLTPALSLTAGARLNTARIELVDEFGNDAAVNGSNHYNRLDPNLGATYKIASGLTAYGGYAEANRAPTPLELACADPSRPCLIDNSLVADPPLKQVVSRTLEAGLRGHFDIGGQGGRASWNLGAFSARNSNDIIDVASVINGRESFQNAGATLRKGIEAALSYRSNALNAYANLTLIDATYRSALTLSSPNNPQSDVNGNIGVVPGDHIPAVPRVRIKLGADYRVTAPWRIGADLNHVGSQYLVGDDSNLNPQAPAYTVVNLDSVYELTSHVEIYAQVMNLFHQHYYAYGTFFETDTVPYLNLSDPRTFIPGAPALALVGVRAAF